MNNAIFAELKFFGSSFIWGILLLIFYDLLRILRRVVKHNVFFVSLQDILYWVICSVLIFHMMYQMNNGIIRGFSILAMLLGMILYHVTFSNFLVSIISGLILKVTLFVNKLIGLLLTPILFIIRRINRFFKYIISKLKKLAVFLIKPLKKIRKSSKIPISDNEKGG